MPGGELVRAIKKTATAILIILITLFVWGTPVWAAVSSFVAEDTNKAFFEYAYADLLDSYALQMLGAPDGLYEDFVAKTTRAFLSETGLYLDYCALLDEYAAALLKGDSFDLNLYVTNTEAKKAVLPATVQEVKVAEGKLVRREKNLAEATNLPETKTAILGKAQVTLAAAQQWAGQRSADQRLIDVAPLYWQYAEKTGIRAEVLYAQAAITTGYGRFVGQIPAASHNWAGIKQAAEAEGEAAFENFVNDAEGVQAHYNHMTAYLGLEPTGEPHPRYYDVLQQPWAGTVLYVEDLSGKWDSAADYHLSVLSLLGQMHKITLNSAEETPKADGTENRPSAEELVAVNTDVLRLRSGPGTEYEILDRLTRGTVLTVLETKGLWHQVVTPTKVKGWVHGDYVTAVETKSGLLKGKTIVIDPGHGGSDPGAVGASGLQEKTINLSIARRLSTLLQEVGAKVILTRNGDQSVSNQQRVDTANNAKADLFVSIHCNAFSNPQSCGTEAHYCAVSDSAAASKYLAQQLLGQLVPVLKLPDRGVKANSFFVLTKTNMPAALVELGFITNAAEEKLLSEEKTQQAASEALLKGIEAYLQKHR